MRLLRLFLLALAAGLVAIAGTSAASLYQPVGRPATLGAAALGPAAPAVQPVTPASSWEHPRVISLPAARVSKPRPVVKPAAHPAPVHRPVAHVSRPAPATDAYPYRTSTTNDHDAWGFTQRQCVSYVAWRLAEAGRPVSNDRDGWGSASNWDDTARQLGVSVNGTPAVGAVAQWDADETSSVWVGDGVGSFSAGSYGHVAFVTAVYRDGSVQVAQYNATGNKAFSTMRLRAPRYIHIP